MKHLLTLAISLLAFQPVLGQAGSLDLSFDPGTGLQDPSAGEGVAIQADGKILLTGGFLYYNGDSSKNIVRINPDGSRDPSFQVGSGFSGPDDAAGASGRCQVVTVQPDGKILVGGRFTSYNDTNARRIVRLLPNGNLDTTFITGSGFNNIVHDILVLPDGRILCAGAFSQYKGVNRSTVAILLPDGTLDPDFIPPVPGPNNAVWKAAVQADGKFLMSGTFTTVSGEPVGRLVRLNPDGTVDAGFPQGTGFNALVLALHVMDDGRILVGGGFTEYDGTPRQRLVRLLPDGTLDPTFSSLVSVNDQVRAILEDEQGRIIIAGNFTSVNGQSRRFTARLLPDGTLDTDYDSSVGPSNVVQDALLQPDGKLIIGGYIHSVGSHSRRGIARLHTSTTTGVQEPDKASFTVHPNPTNGIVTVRGELEGPVDVRVLDDAGRLVHEMQVRGNGAEPLQVDLGSLAPGAYMIQLRTKHGTATRMVVRE